MHRPLRKRTPRSTRRGAAAVEFAISIAVLLAIVFASIEMTRVMMVRHAVTHASYLAARKVMVVGGNRDEAEAAAADHLQEVGVSLGSVVVNPSVITDETKMIEVVVNIPVSGNSWIAPLYFGGDISGRTRIMTERAAVNTAEVVAPAEPEPPVT